MDVKLSQKAKDSIESFSKKHKWFSDLYDSMFKAIKESAEIELSSMEVGKIVPHCKENWKEFCKTSIYLFRITYILQKGIKEDVLHVIDVKLT